MIDGTRVTGQSPKEGAGIITLPNLIRDSAPRGIQGLVGWCTRPTPSAPLPALVFYDRYTSRQSACYNQFYLGPPPLTSNHRVHLGNHNTFKERRKNGTNSASVLSRVSHAAPRNVSAPDASAECANLSRGRPPAGTGARRTNLGARGSKGRERYPQRDVTPCWKCC